LVTVNELMSPVPEAANPIAVLLFVHDTPVPVLANVTLVVPPLQTT